MGHEEPSPACCQLAGRPAGCLPWALLQSRSSNLFERNETSRSHFWLISFAPPLANKCDHEFASPPFKQHNDHRFNVSIVSAAA